MLCFYQDIFFNVIDILLELECQQDCSLSVHRMTCRRTKDVHCILPPSLEGRPSMIAFDHVRIELSEKCRLKISLERVILWHTKWENEKIHKHLNILNYSLRNLFLRFRHDGILALFLLCHHNFVFFRHAQG